jgi:hypothetical protein
MSGLLALLRAPAAELSGLRDIEFPKLTDSDWAAVAGTVAEALRVARIIELAMKSPRLLINAEQVRTRVRETSRDVLAAASLSPYGMAAYERLLSECCLKIAQRAKRSGMSTVDYEEPAVEIRRWELLDRHLATVTAVKLVGNVSLGPLARLPRLAALELASNEDAQHLEPLTRCPGLVSLRVTGYSAVRDLSALAGTKVDELELHQVGELHADLASLAGARLRRLSLVAGRLVDLPPDLPLRQLSVVGVPSVEEIHALAALPGLTHLQVHQPRAADLIRLRVLTNLQEIDIHGAVDHEVAAAALPGMLLRQWS